MGHEFLPAEEGASLWVAQNCCTVTDTEVPSGEHIKMEWENCSSGRHAVHFKLNGVAHELPANIEDGTMQYVIDFLSEARK
jgi:hypothetical protein